jgi:enamine deaminase RidA (YjgF/YER057c/UK114 family)
MSIQAPLRAAVTVAPDGRPSVLSPAVIGEGCFVYVSGQGPLVDGTYTPAPIDVEARRALSNLGGVIEVDAVAVLPEAARERLRAAPGEGRDAGTQR